MGRAVVLAEIANLAIARIGDHRLGGRGIHADDVDGQAMTHRLQPVQVS